MVLTSDTYQGSVVKFYADFLDEFDPIIIRSILKK